MISLALLLPDSHKNIRATKNIVLDKALRQIAAYNSEFTFTNYPPNKIESCDAAKANARTKFMSRSKL